MDEVDASWPLIRFLLDDATYNATYRGYLEEAANTVYEPARAQARFTKARTLIEPYVIGQEGEQTGYTHLTSPSEFATAHDELLAHPQLRATAVRELMGK